MGGVGGSGVGGSGVGGSGVGGSGVGGSGVGGGGGAPTPAPGDLVPSYGQGGFVLGDTAPGFQFQWEVHDVAIDSNGRAILAGLKDTNGLRDFMVVRYQTNGAVDFSKTDDIGTHADEANAVTTTSNGSIVLAGIANNGVTDHIGLIRYLPDGTIDNSFDNDGKVMTPVGWNSSAWDVVADGEEIVVAGSTRALVGNNDFCVVRYDHLGKPKSSFDYDGIVTVDFGGDDEARAVAVQSDGRVVVAGDVGDQAIGIARLNADGSLDKTFGASQSGKRLLALGSEISTRGIAIASDGKIVIAAESAKDFLALRLTSAGALDTSFSSDGKALVDYTSLDEPHAVLLDASGHVLLAAAAVTGTPPDSHEAIVRLKDDGSPDLGFGVGGLAVYPQSTSFGERAFAIRDEADGYLIAGTQSVAGGVRMLSAKIAH